MAAQCLGSGVPIVPDGFGMVGCCTGCCENKPPRCSGPSSGLTIKREEFVPWFLDKAYPYTKYFTGSYKFTSFVVYTYGRPRYAAWARLAKEVQDAATSLGIAVSSGVQLPAMPHLDAPTRALSMTFPVHTSPRRLQRIAEQLSSQAPLDADS